MKHFLAIATVILAVFLSSISLAVNPDEVLDDPALEARARAISADLRCVVCQNQAIDDSDAELARDLRLLVRERLVAGDSDKQTVRYIVDRYGEFVLLKPVIGWHTLALWLSAPAILIAGIFFLIIKGRNSLPAPPARLSAEEQAALDQLLEGDEGRKRGD